MPACEHVEVSGTKMEKLNPEAVITPESIKAMTIKADKISGIDPNSQSANPRFKGSGKKTWLCNLSAMYPDGTGSSRIFIKGVVIDVLRFKEGTDYFYYGIPYDVAKHVVETTLPPLKVTCGLKGIDAKASDGYVWVSGRLERLTQILLLGNERKFKSLTFAQLVSSFSRQGVNPICYMVMKPRLTCTCPQETTEAEVLQGPWTMGGTPEGIYVYGDVTKHSPSMLSSADSGHMVVCPPDTLSSDFVHGLVTNLSTSPFDASATGPAKPKK